MSKTTYYNEVLRTKTEFELTFSPRIIKLVRNNYYNKKKTTLEDVIGICKEYNITYSKYQQMESLFIRKLQSANVCV